jgi:hypothetical protein
MVVQNLSEHSVHMFLNVLQSRGSEAYGKDSILQNGIDTCCEQLQSLSGAQPSGAGEPASQTAEGNACKLNSVKCSLVLHVLVCDDCAKIFGAGGQWNPKLLIRSASEAKPFFPITPGRQGSPQFAEVGASHGE